MVNRLPLRFLRRSHNLKSDAKNAALKSAVLGEVDCQVAFYRVWQTRARRVTGGRRQIGNRSGKWLAGLSKKLRLESHQVANVERWRLTRAGMKTYSISPTCLIGLPPTKCE